MVNKALRCIFMQVPDEQQRRCADFVLLAYLPAITLHYLHILKPHTLSEW